MGDCQDGGVIFPYAASPPAPARLSVVGDGFDADLHATCSVETMPDYHIKTDVNRLPCAQ